jgi:hypothetical protein
MLFGSATITHHFCYIILKKKRQKTDHHHFCYKKSPESRGNHRETIGKAAGKKMLISPRHGGQGLW